MSVVNTYEEWRVTGRWGNTPYEFVWAPIGGAIRFVGFEHPEFEARNFIDAMHENNIRWADGPHLHKRTVTVTEWEAIEP